MARKTKQQALVTRRQILEAAISEFSERGVSSTSLADIALTAGVTRGAIYWHFKNKVELFDEIWQLLELQMNGTEVEYQAKYPDNPLRILRELMIHMLVLTAEDPLRRAMLEIIFHKCELVGETSALREARKALYLESYEHIEQALCHCIQHGQLPADLNTRQAAIMLRALMSGLMESWLFMPESFELRQEASHYVDTCLDMLQMSTALRHVPVTTTE